jgi:hypothetical protein
MKNLIAKYEGLGFHLSIKEEPLIIAYCVRIKSKARYKKPLFNYRFRSIERMLEYCNEWIGRVEANINSENEKKARKKEARVNMNHNFEVGNILYDSWGYDQTNIDFYQVVEVKPKSIKIREIGGSYVEGTQGFMCSYVKPVANSFGKEAILKKINVSINYNGHISYYIKSKHGAFSHYVESEKGVYSSWYA